MITRIARFSFRKPGLVLVAWALALVGVVFASRALGNNFSNSIGLRSSESEMAIATLQERFESQSGATGTIIFKAHNGVDDAQTKEAVHALAGQVQKVDHVTQVVDPYSLAGSKQLSSNGTIGYLQVQFDRPANEVPDSAIADLKDMVANANSKDLQVEAGGEVFAQHNQHESKEFLGLIAAAVILLVAFGSLVAMGLPLITAIFGVGIGAGVVALLSHVIALPEASVQIVAMIGIGVGIDYALLILTRYRQELARHPRSFDAMSVAMDTAGRSVIFAGSIVVIAMLGMLVTGIGIMQALGIATAIVVLIMMLGSITLLPALFAYLGDWLKPKRTDLQPKQPTKTVWTTWGAFVEKRAWLVLVGGIGLLSVLALPAFSMRLGSSDAGSRATSNTLRRAYDLQAEGFGVGSNGPLLLVAKLDGKQDLAAMERLKDAAQADANVAAVGDLVINEKRNAALLQVIPKTAPQDTATADLVTRLRSQTIPAATKGNNATVYVGGVTASFADVAKAIADKLPLFIGAVLTLSFVVLVVVFRSIFIPLKAVVLNLLSVGAAYGVLVAVFQWGWLKDVFGLGATGPIESFLPIILFAILFGLSMDYEVFLLSRIKEAYNKTGDNAAAIVSGLSATGRVITAAAAIMVVVFASFIFDGERVVKEFGLGLAVAVLVDATIVRLMLVPAAMSLFNTWNWWLPQWLRRLPEVGIDTDTASRQQPRQV